MTVAHITLVVLNTNAVRVSPTVLFKILMEQLNTYQIQFQLAAINSLAAAADI
jgi:hypothetical protein